MQTISELQHKRNEKKTSHIIWTAIGYGFFGTVFVLIFDLAKVFLTQTPCHPNFPCNGDARRGIPLDSVLISALFSVVFVKFLFAEIIKSELKRWFLILTMTSITAILLQTVFILSRTDLTLGQIISMYSGEEMIEKILAPNLMINLFLILTPFTILFANRWKLIEKIKNKYSLK